MNRSGISRLETRSTRANKEELVKRVMLTVEHVRKWEKKWVDSDVDGCTLKIYKWVPVSDDDLKKAKAVQNNVQDSMMDTSSPLTLEENGLSGKENKCLQQNKSANAHTETGKENCREGVTSYQGISITGKNEDGCQSLQGTTENKRLESNGKPSLSESSNMLIHKASASFNIITTPSEYHSKADEPPMKKAKEDATTG